LIAEFCPEGVARIQIGGAVKKLRTGLNPRQNFNLNSPDATGYYVTVRELGGFEIRITEKTDKVSSDALEVIQKRSELQVGDVLFSGTGTIGRTALVSAAPLDWNIKEGVYALTPNAQVLDSRYFIYLLSSFNIRLHILSKSSGSTVGSIPFSELVKIEIPIPPLQVQREIVSILDKLDALVNDLTFGLPAEITARRKQYEYYRNKLLTFKELEAA
jgi:type I restriction enzyme S subunit